MHEGKGRETDVCTEIQKTQRFVVTVYQFWVFLIALCLQLSAWILSHFSSSASLKHISLSVASRCLLHWLNTVISALSYQLTRSHSPSYTVCLNSIKYTLFCLFDILKLLKVTLKEQVGFLSCFSPFSANPVYIAVLPSAGQFICSGCVWAAGRRQHEKFSCRFSHVRAASVINFQLHLK